MAHYEAQRFLGAIFNNNRKEEGRGNHLHADNMVNIGYTSKSFRNWNVLKDQGASDSSSQLLVNIK
jgi:hypothetical protein